MHYLQVQTQKELSKTKNREFQATGQVTQHLEYDGEEQVKNDICFKQRKSENHGHDYAYLQCQTHWILSSK